jgi:hypothetical protein
MPPYFFRLEKSSGFCHPVSIATRPSFLGSHNWRQISGVLDGQWRFTESLARQLWSLTSILRFAIILCTRRYVHMLSRLVVPLLTK